MGTWEEESSELFEHQNEITKHVSSDGSHGDANDLDIKVEGGGDGDECRDRDIDVVREEGALVEQFERVGLGNNGSDGYKYEEENREEEHGNHVYPLRPNAADCSYYIKTGSCKFGPNCRFNHPPRGFQAAGDNEKGFQERIGSVGDAGKIECKYFQTAGGCKYGDACRYNHSARRTERERPDLNFLGLPVRPMAQECTYFLQTGSCGYGTNCRFNHPDPSSNGNSVRGDISVPRNYAGVPLQPFGGVSQGASGSPNGMNLRNGPRYGPEMSSYHQTMTRTPGWNQTQVNSSIPANKYPIPHHAMNNVSARLDPLPHHPNMLETGEFPERPGQPDCDYFMKTGNCKYRTACRYNHPRSLASKPPPPLLSSKGLYSRPATMQPVETSQFLNSNSNNMRRNGTSFPHHQSQQMQNGEFPERVGQPECEYYMKTGQCKYKSACRYHHPRNRVPTSSECALSEKGLPLRPGAKLCRNYEQQGTCKYGPNCLFNHPDDYSADVAQFHSSSNVPAAANSEPSADNHVGSAWDDGWGI
ncbi:zinc finger CCCH domain-containing protein 43-like [Silene latifolia]|uniref:zinc finger CCCH domain-containing protein 43-like n=1 Tax=Silene latifolia TaxID=37657 RepID=UPI003D77C3A6